VSLFFPWTWTAGAVVEPEEPALPGAAAVDTLVCGPPILGLAECLPPVDAPAHPRPTIIPTDAAITEARPDTTTVVEVDDCGIDISTTLPTALPVTLNAKGAYVTICESVPFTTSRILFHLGQAGGVFADLQVLVDVATGATGSEVITAPDLIFSTNSATDETAEYDVPLAVAAGTRIAARVGTEAVGPRLGLTLMGADPFLTSYGSVTTYGALVQPAATASFRFNGTEVDPGAVAHTKGAWVTITSSTTATHNEWLLGIGSARNDFRDNRGSWLIDIAVGATGSEVVEASNLPLDQALSGNFTGGTLTPPVTGPLPIAVPAGSRVAIRAQSSLTTETGFPTGTLLRKFFAVLYGMTA
jgi:hypothetical protein